MFSLCILSFSQVKRNIPLEDNGWYKSTKEGWSDDPPIYGYPQPSGPYHQQFSSEDPNAIGNSIKSFWPYETAKIESFTRKLKFQSRESTAKTALFKYDMVGLNEEQGTRRSSLKGIFIKVHVGINPQNQKKVYEATIDYSEIIVGVQAQQTRTIKTKKYGGLKKKTKREKWSRELKAHELQELYSKTRSAFDQLMSTGSLPPPPPQRKWPWHHKIANLAPWGSSYFRTAACSKAEDSCSL